MGDLALLGALLSSALLVGCAKSEEHSLPDGYWPPQRTAPILDKTITLHLDPDLSSLSATESSALDKLLEAGRIAHELYLRSQHPESLQALADLQALDAAVGPARATTDLLKLYRIFKGPIATTLDNERKAFVPVQQEMPGRNIYPDGLTREQLDAYLAKNPNARQSLLHVRTAVRTVSVENLNRDLTSLKQYPTLARLHPELRPTLNALQGSMPAQAFYAVPYAVAYADEIFEIYALIREAAAELGNLDPDFAAYLHHRARDLLANDYEAGDASWVKGKFTLLNAQIGSYESYDDKLYGVKSFFSFSLLLRNQQRSQELEKALSNLQALQDSLPYRGTKRVSSDIPVGVYDVIADFGQSRSANTATILPNESHAARKYGRTILLRHNIMSHPRLFADRQAAFEAAVAEAHGGDLSLEGGFYQTLWHEIGHYLGPDRTNQGDDLNSALAEHANLLEEMKADLVSLFLGPALLSSGHYSKADLRGVYAAGARRVLQKVEPRRDQPYQTMQLMQMNYFLEHGLLSFDAASERLNIHYDNYHPVVEALLSEVLAIQKNGGIDAASKLVERYGYWEEGLHGVIAKAMERASPYRYRLIYYAALGE